MKALICSIGILISCAYKDKFVSSNDTASIADMNYEASDSSYNRAIDSIEYAYGLVRKCKLISSSFDKKNISSIKTFLHGDIRLSLIKIEGNKEYAGWNGDPVYNLLTLHTAFGIEYFKSFSSVYDNDFVFHKKISGNYIFENYSSTVGYTTLVIVDDKKNIFISDKINEEQVLIPESIAPGESFFKVKNPNDKISLKQLSKVEWDRCSK